VLPLPYLQDPSDQDQALEWKEQSLAAAVPVAAAVAAAACGLKVNHMHQYKMSALSATMYFPCIFKYNLLKDFSGHDEMRKGLNTFPYKCSTPTALCKGCALQNAFILSYSMMQTLFFHRLPCDKWKCTFNGYHLINSCNKYTLSPIRNNRS
jgi:hypothetical protein